MQALTEPTIKQPRHDDGLHAAKDWLDALASGACDQRAFLSGVSGLLHRAPDAGWDLLALVDQYYRRGKISAEDFATLNSHLQGLLVGKETGAAVSVPLPEPSVTSYAARSPAPMTTAPTVSVPIFIDSPGEDAAPVAASESDRSRLPRVLAVGEVLRGRYRVQGVLGRGGMGTVFAAVDQFRLDQANVNQRVAIKVLHTEVIKQPRLFAELRREFHYLQSLSHPNIVRVHEFDRDGDLAFFTMEYLSGALLSHVLAVEKAPMLYRPYALAILRDVGAAVAHAHSRGVVHGDLNPGNIFITNNGEVRVLDFGASHQLHHGPWISEVDDHKPVVVATPSFASCQVLEGEVADARDDVYAVACVAYVLLTGRHPFRGATALKARTSRLSPDRPGGLDRRQWKALREGLQFDRGRRPSDIQAWIGRLDLHAAAAHLPEMQSLWAVRPRRLSALRWVLVGMVIAFIIAGAWFATANEYSIERALAAVTAPLKSMLPKPVVEASATAASSTPRAPIVAAAPPVGAHSGPAAAVAPAATPAPTAPPAPATLPASIGAAAGQNGYALRARIELASDSTDVAPTEPMARIVVRRSRSSREDVSFKWWTESGTAKPGQDFVSVKTRVEHIESGKNSVDLIVPIVQDPARRTPRSFYVVIDEASDNATLGPRTLTMITLPGSE